MQNPTDVFSRYKSLLERALGIYAVFSAKQAPRVVRNILQYSLSAHDVITCTWAPSWLTLRSVFLAISLLQDINSVNFPFVGAFWNYLS